jgi:hypothetical protein
MKIVARYSWIPVVLLVGLLTASGCKSTGGSGEVDSGADKAAASSLAAIRENYAPIPCFSSSFDIEMKQAGKFARRARGQLRVDNEQDRMRLVIRDRILGLSLSEMTLREGNVYLKNIGQNRQVIPRDRFQVAGLGNNSIVLPFSLFQELLYGRIPDEVYSNYDSVKNEPEGLVVRLTKPDAAYLYRFNDNRLAFMNYEPVGQTGQVDVALTGQVAATTFPKRIDIAMKEGAQIRETMKILFHRVDTRAQCTDARFPTR